MELDFGRLRAGEWVIGIGSLLLLIAMSLPWYALGPTLATGATEVGAATKGNAWQTLGAESWLMLVTALCGVLTLFLQSTRRAPALPICLTVVTTTLGVLTAVLVAFRVFDVPSSTSGITEQVGAFLGLVFAVSIPVGGYLSMRRDGIAAEDAPAEIETFALARSTPSTG